MRIWHLLIVAVACLPVSSAFAEQSTQVVEDEVEQARAKDAASRYWKAREINDLHTAFRMEAAALPGGWLTPALMARQGLALRGPVLQLQKWEQTTAHFRVRAMVEIGALGFVAQETIDRWILIDGRWFRDTPKP
jgi:hypothetical protein